MAGAEREATCAAHVAPHGTAAEESGSPPGEPAEAAAAGTAHPGAARSGYLDATLHV